MNVLHINVLHIAVNGWFVGQTHAGSGQYIEHLLTHLPQLPRQVRLSLVLPQGTAPSVKLHASIQPLYFALPPGPAPLRKLWWEQVTLPFAARQLGVDLLWNPYWTAPLWQPCPVCVTVHDLIPRLLPVYHSKLQHRLYTALVSYTTRRAASILTVSHASARDIVTHLHVPPERVHVVYHGPNQAGISQPTPDELAAVRRRYTLPERYFFYMGAFDARKNLAGALAAYVRYLELGGDPAVKFVLAGRLPPQDTAFSPDPRRQAAELGLSEQMHYCGWVEEADKPALYALATALVFPSLYEGFGMTVLEAMAAGTPVITSK